ncbi:hypothetical protein LSAT2_007979 [Lamellibrachia satsuma]|nr:hypothetical protein LSAT2_007979 [Lamellibrachia satsuma]
MSSPVGIVWTLLSILLSGICSVGFLQPFWFVNLATGDAIGLYSYCLHKRYDETDFETRTCEFYSVNFRLADLPTNAWQVACLSYAAGCALLCKGALLAMLTMWLPSRCTGRVVKVAAFSQTLAVLFLLAGLLSFPLGLDSELAQVYCGRCSAFDSGSCAVGWTYMIATAATALAVFCPILSRYTDMTVDDLLPLSTM